MDNFFEVVQDREKAYKAQRAKGFGTGLVGYIRTTLKDLTDVFGPPHPEDPNGDGKVKAEWYLLTEEGDLVTIYVYKVREVPTGLYDWHVGGRGKRALTILTEIAEYVNLKHEGIS